MTPRTARRPARVVGALAIAVLLGAGAALAAPLAASAAATWTVTDTNDDPATTTGSLRWAVAQAASGDTITFDPAVSAVALTSTVALPLGVTVDGGGTVTLSPAGGLVDALLEVAPTAADQDYAVENLDFSGSGESRAVQVTSGTSAARDVTFSNVTIQGFRKDVGAGIDVDDVSGTVTIDSSTLVSNTATGDGGAALSYTAPDGVALVVSNTTIAANLAVSTGAGDGAVSVENSPAAAITFEGDSIIGNVVADGGGAAAGGAGIGLGGDGGTIGALTVTDTMFRANGTTPSAGLVAPFEGGGLAAFDAASVTITGSTFDGNAAEKVGGGLFLEGMDATAPILLQNDTLSGNTLPAGGGFGSTLGGGAFLADNAGSATFTGLTATGNTADIGGAIAFEHELGGFDISGAVFQDNTAGANAGEGGALFVDEIFADSTVSASTFSGNTSNEGGSGIYLLTVDGGVSLTVQSSTFTANVFAGCGCSRTGLSVYALDIAGTLSIADSTFDENSSVAPATPANAIQADEVERGAAFLVSNSTVVAVLGIDVGNIERGSTARVTHTIVQVPPATDAITVDAGRALDLRWSLLSSAAGAPRVADTTGNQFGTDAQLATLASNGGPTQTLLPLTGSPAIDAGDPAFSDPVTLDQRGLTRIVRVIDIGAVEVQATTPARLPATGVPIGGALAAAVVLLLLGASAVGVRRRLFS